MTDVQFEALAQLLRLRGGQAQEAARLVLVDGLSPVAAAAKLGMSYNAAYQAVSRAQRGLDLARRVAGGAPV